MENGHDGKLTEKFSGLNINQHGQQHEHDQSNLSSNNNDNLYQVMKAVEAAEATIKQQVEENSRLRSELLSKIQELEKYRHEDSVDQKSHLVAQWKEQEHGSYEARQSAPSIARSNTGGHSENSQINGTLRVQPNDQLPMDNTGYSQLSSPSTRSISPSRHLLEGVLDSRFNSPRQGLMPGAETNNNNNSLLKQDLAINKVREHEEEIILLRKHLSDYSVKEAQIRNEKYVLEKRIAYMRLAFDQQQQDLVDAASKALSYRQDIIEENIRLTYALQDAQQERSTFVSSLLPLLAEYSLQPPVPDAQSIVSNVKVLFKHLQEKLLLTESKLKESQYQLTPWRSDTNHANVATQSQPHSIGAPLATSNKNGLELVPQHMYSQVKPQVSVDAQAGTDWGLLGRNQNGLSGGVATSVDTDDLGRFSPLASRNSSAHDASTHLVVTQGDTRPAHYGDEVTNKQVTFRVPVSNNEVDDPDGDGTHSMRETSANWSSGNPPYTTTVDDPSSSYSPYLPAVLEEPSSSFSEAADEDPLPAIEGLQISGEAFPGRELKAGGYSINGTTSCNFEWIRHLEDGSFNYIDGAKQPIYLVNADDVGTLLAIEVQPLDNRKRKGEPVKVFANDNKKIACDPEMQNHIEKAFNSGHASYRVSLSTGYLDIWEPATLTIKREGYSIKCSGPNGFVITEKFSPSTTVMIPYGHTSEFIIIGSSGAEHLLKAENNTDFSGARDTIVLTLRLFIRRRPGKRRVKKKGLFF
ncbi:hypothetical protein AAZX31_10G165400 [Glycine max]|uniref:Uncharacterized protein n=3 Tax=Glycine subgen. Soja TaxID=1462606 RepID=K7LK01_SOYBN|nr:uncharacterized protein LOC100817814 isoform X2 [Glycine max]RZB87770.1 hypothetical protein D0Y65_027359 [Glycine soja]KAG5004452.1 hypothetical protein JHK86_028591 [Glycine max]KAG5127631.1 hypothetical protein JHK82_028466 [Glycine max]KAH1138786.1 hypothetical protein GYH30_028311 [Glycine max]KRH34306.1 hypothetical protein GLYMA_10G175300v4 [Glycine max]